MIPVCVPVLGEKELEYVVDCIKTNWISSKGKYVEEFEAKFADYCGCKYGVTTTSGTTARSYRSFADYSASPHR